MKQTFFFVLLKNIRFITVSLGVMFLWTPCLLLWIIVICRKLCGDEKGWMCLYLFDFSIVSTFTSLINLQFKTDRHTHTPCIYIQSTLTKVTTNGTGQKWLPSANSQLNGAVHFAPSPRLVFEFCLSSRSSNFPTNTLLQEINHFDVIGTGPNK